ncbi:cupin domain-containing protein [Dictyobacter aurantiacus]|uniref:Cupin type-2 domain-containing protein n=1 Tax=Dictyobacter aurantiacus TaxID=1936993 RepID=A0A401ZJ89_9CHLR|nr:cupin domain-containing protein [Dictyobacter aurantiacus]GCE06916.1 hypothetical protein KDAU_42450 [Dictyobacter aurantiacus]
MQIRRFSSDVKSKVPGGHAGLYAVPILHEDAHSSPEQLETYARKVNGLPLFSEGAPHVVALYFEPHATMDEHSAPHPILFMVVHGSGFVRIGGPQGETQPVRAGDAILWPPHVDHHAWTDDSELHAIVIEGWGPPSRT